MGIIGTIIVGLVVGALARLQALVDEVARPEIPRRATKPSRAAKRRRLDGKSHRGAIKAGRQRVGE